MFKMVHITGEFQGISTTCTYCSWFSWRWVVFIVIWLSEIKKMNSWIKWKKKWIIESAKGRMIGMDGGMDSESYGWIGEMDK